MEDVLPANESLSVARTLDFSYQNKLGADGIVKETQPALDKDENVYFGRDADGEVTNTLQNVSDGFPREDELHNDADIKEVDSHSVQGASKKGIEVKDSPAGSKADGFQELLQLAQEFESEEAAKRKDDEAATNSLEDPIGERLPQENGVLHTDEHPMSAMKENKSRLVKNTDTQSQKSEAGSTKKGGYLMSQAPKARLSTPSATLSKGALKIAGRKKTTDEEIQQGAESLPLPSNVYQRSISIGPSRSNFTVPQPFALATDKRASMGGRPLDEAMAMANKSRLIGAVGNLSLKNPQVSKKMGSKLFMVKSVHSESMKHHEDSFMKLGKPLEPRIDDDEVQSVSSVQSASKTPKGKASTTRSAHVFNFKCDERAEKRKEFYSKLEEKQHAKEEEKNQMQAKTKEEMEAEIKQLRRSLTFKATPMPSFYQEGAPPKMELKKIPLTRAKSPKLGRRGSCAGLGSEGISTRICRRSIHSEQEHSSSDSLQKVVDENGDKGSTYSKKPIRKSLSKLPTEASKSTRTEILDNPEPDPASSADLDFNLTNGSVENMKLRVRQESSGSSVSGSDDENAEHIDTTFPDQESISDHEISNTLESRSDQRVLTTEIENCEVALDFGSSGQPIEGIKELNSSLISKAPQKSERNRVKTVSDSKVRTGKISSQVASEEQNVKAVKSTKRERLKASTPSFRRSVVVKHSTKNEQELTLVAADVAVQS